MTQLMGPKRLSLQDFGVTEKLLMKAKIMALEAMVERLQKENQILLQQRNALQRRRK